MSLDLSLKRYVTNNKNDTTHTKIGSTELNVFGNKYNILQENEKKFYEDYKRHVFEKKEDAEQFVAETYSLYCSGPSAGGGARTSITKETSTASILIDRKIVEPQINIEII